MANRRPYEVRLATAAAKELRRLDGPERRRVEDALRREAARVADPQAGRGSKTVKRIRGRRDRFHRLRVGGRRILFDLDHSARVLLVHGIVDRRDLDRWLRAR